MKKAYVLGITELGLKLWNQIYELLVEREEKMY
jgi:hypothetical protein